MNNWPVWKKSIATIFLGLLVSSCAPTYVATGGIGGTGISWGAVTAFGSVYVNGVHYDTSNLDKGVWIDGNQSNYNQLKVGMVLRVYGTNNGDGTGTARRLEYKSLAKGPATVIANDGSGTGQLMMFGQTVEINPGTIFDDNRVAASIIDLNSLDLAVDNSLYLEISGYQAPSNTIYARRIEIKKDWVNGDSVRLMGTVGSVISGSSFTIGSQAIVYDSATDNLNGKYVEVEGTYSGSTFTADMVTEDELGVNGSDGDEFELEGVVTSIPASNIFTLNGQQVDISAATYEPNTKGIGDLLVGAEVEAEGVFDANGILVAETIEFEDKGSEIDGVGIIDTINSGAKTLTLQTTAFVITVNNDTEIRDHRGAGLDQFTFANFSAGMNLQFKYYDDGMGNNIATRIDIEDP